MQILFKFSTLSKMFVKDLIKTNFKASNKICYILLVDSTEKHLKYSEYHSINDQQGHKKEIIYFPNPRA